jgi:hypothetical protein
MHGSHRPAVRELAVERLTLAELRRARRAVAYEVKQDALDGGAHDSISNTVAAQHARPQKLRLLSQGAQTPALANEPAEIDRSSSMHQFDLDDLFDRLTNELIVRYRANPRLALLLLPTASPSPSDGNVVLLIHHDPKNLRPGLRRRAARDADNQVVTGAGDPSVVGRTS